MLAFLEHYRYLKATTKKMLYYTIPLRELSNLHIRQGSLQDWYHKRCAHLKVSYRTRKYAPNDHACALNNPILRYPWIQLYLYTRIEVKTIHTPFRYSHSSKIILLKIFKVLNVFSGAIAFLLE